MARAFVIRPFGKKQDSAGREFDFEAAHTRVIGPALESAGLAGSTTIEVIDAGNIRQDMFALIIEADLVVCDVTLLNANVFYELGIRHALRRKGTVLVKQAGSADGTPFDLLTDRYLVYDVNDPEAVTKLARVVEATLRSDRETDSPVFGLLPDLPEADPSTIQVVPRDFREEVGRARAAASKGWLRLLAQDVAGRRFERPGLQLIADAQRDLKDYEGARESLERIRNIQPGHVAANLALANVYERLHREQHKPAHLAASDQAIQRVLEGQGLRQRDRVEALALQGRNLKTRWRLDLADLRSVEARRAVAMSERLRECARAYRAAFDGDLNHFWSGLAALQMATIFLELSDGDEAWKATFDEDAKADAYRRRLAEDVAVLRQVVPASVDAALTRLPADDPERIWALVSKADVLFLTEANDQRVVNRYRDTIPKDQPFVWDAARGQLQLFADLGVRAGRAQKVIAEVDGTFAGTAPPAAARALGHLVLFAGHQVDRPGREHSRFPAAKAEVAARLIRDAVTRLVADGADTLALASAAPGGDLLFHEACDAAGVPSVVCLPMPADEYSRQTFADLDDWRRHFLSLQQRSRARGREALELSDQPGLPRWLHGTSVNAWERGNRWVLHMALASGAPRLTLLALWDGQPEGDPAGGTAHMVRIAREAGRIDVQVIDARLLL